jgi:dATP pyrophosphohydrolase
LRRVQEHNGFWQGVSGAPLEDETDVVAAAREVAEETGLTMAEPIRLDYRYEFSVEPHWRRLYAPGVETITEEVYAVKAPSDWEPTLEPREHEEYRWCAFDEAEKMLVWRENIEALRVLRRRLSSPGQKPGIR